MYKVFTIFILAFLTACSNHIPKNFDVPPVVPCDYDTGIFGSLGDGGRIDSEEQERKYLDCLRSDVKISIPTGKDIISNEQIVFFVSRAITNSDQMCRSWLQSNHQRDKAQDSAQGELNIYVDSLMSLMSFTGSPQKHVGTVATMLAGSNALIENNQSYFRLTTTLAKLYEKLEVVRKEYASVIKEKSESGSLDPESAIQEVLSYHYSCSRMAVEQFLSDSVELANFKIENSNTLKLKDKLQLNEASIKIAKIIFNSDSTMSKESLFLLYAATRLPSGSLILDNLSNVNRYNQSVLDAIDQLSSDQLVRAVQELSPIIGVLNFEQQLNDLIAASENVSEKEATAASIADGSPSKTDVDKAAFDARENLNKILQGEKDTPDSVTIKVVPVQ